MKYVVVSGGVVSGLGKGITSSSIGMLLRSCGLRITSIKIDPYLNIDAGTMSPYEHGEVYVLDDGGEADLDLGNYERFCEIRLTRDHNITTGKVYKEVMERERRGDYLGKTVQVVPHVTDAVQGWIERVAAIPVDDSQEKPQVCIIELGGTVGDIESMVFLEALRQFRYRVGDDNMVWVHVSLIPEIGGDNEQKSKPTQHGLRELRAVGLSPDLIVCRSKHPIERSVRAKISMFGMVPASHVIGIHDLSNLYRVPLLLLQEGVVSLLLNKLRENRMPPEHLSRWEKIADVVDTAEHVVTIGVVGKYTGLTDSYLSVTKSLLHAAIDCNLKLQVKWIESSKLERNPLVDPSGSAHEEAWAAVRSVDGLLIPGGFGDRGIEGKIAAARYARENNIPYLGICLGMQIAVIEFARHVRGLQDANSAEFNPQSPHTVVINMPEIRKDSMGGTMRLGLRQTTIVRDSLAFQLYGQEQVWERHRHRYEVNPEYIEVLEKGAAPSPAAEQQPVVVAAAAAAADEDETKRPADDEVQLRFTGKDGQRMEILELTNHRFFLATQYHPEFTSRPMTPSPPFLGFVKAAAHRAEDGELDFSDMRRHKFRANSRPSNWEQDQQQ